MIVLATTVVITSGSIVLYIYFKQPKEPTDARQTTAPEVTSLARVAYRDSSFLDDLSQTISDIVTGSQVGLVAHIYNISDLAKTDDDVNNIIARIKKDIEPKSWYDNNRKAGATIIAYNSEQTKNLTIRQSQPLHEQIAVLLKSMKLYSDQNAGLPSED